MIRLAAAAAIVVVAVAVAALLSRRQRQRTVGFAALPTRVDPRALGLTPPGVVAFVSPGCRSCAAALATVEASGHPYAVVDEAGARRAAGVTEVPTVVEVDGDGVVLRGWVGPLPAGAFDAGPPR